MSTPPTGMLRCEATMALPIQRLTTRELFQLPEYNRRFPLDKIAGKRWRRFVGWRCPSGWVVGEYGGPWENDPSEITILWHRVELLLVDPDLSAPAGFGVTLLNYLGDEFVLVWCDTVPDGVVGRYHDGRIWPVLSQLIARDQRVRRGRP